MNVNFNGKVMDYGNGYSIECEYIEGDYSYVFHVLKEGEYITHNMCILEQAHNLVLNAISSIEG